MLGLGVIIFLLSAVELVPAAIFAYDLSGGGIMGCFFGQSCVPCAAKHDKHEGGDPGHEATTVSPRILKVTGTSVKVGLE